MECEFRTWSDRDRNIAITSIHKKMLWCISIIVLDRHRDFLYTLIHRGDRITTNGKGTMMRPQPIHSTAPQHTSTRLVAAGVYLMGWTTLTPYIAEDNMPAGEYPS